MAEMERLNLDQFQQLSCDCCCLPLLAPYINDLIYYDHKVNMTAIANLRLTLFHIKSIMTFNHAIDVIIYQLDVDDDRYGLLS